MSVVFFAKKYEELPVCQHIGEVLRIHRATVGQYKDQKQLTANICFNSSWAIFAPVTADKKAVNDMTPSTFFGKSMHTQAEDMRLVKSLRQWSATTFAKNIVLSTKYITKLSAAQSHTTKDGKNMDFDL